MLNSSALEQRLLNDFQHNFPLCSRPFAAIGETVGCGEETALGLYRRFQAQSLISRIGPVFASGRVGQSTLAAMAVPDQELERVAALISDYPEVNHNYRRENDYNLWFVVTASDQPHLDSVLAHMARHHAHPLIVLPMEASFHIDLGFDFLGGQKKASAFPQEKTPVRLTQGERLTLGGLEKGLPLVPRPYHDLAETLGLTEADLLSVLDRCLEGGVLKRFGVVLRHAELGYVANAMCVWNVPDEQVPVLGPLLGQEAGVTLCYQRRRALPDWPYNLYCMIHGKAREEVMALRESIGRKLGLDGWPHEILFSLRQYKQQGACYGTR